jgi:ABC-type uncharacterized transport system involved in gliding motility auxiliary subunit
MDSKWKRFAPIGLLVAGLGLLSAIGFYIVQQEVGLGVQISLAVAVLGLAANILLDVEGARKSFTGRQARYGSNALILALAFLGVVIVANYLAYQNDKRWDLTENQDNSLAPETMETLTKLPEPVVAKAFYTFNNTAVTSAESLLKRYELNSDGRFSYEVIDPDSDPIAAEQAGFTRDGDIVLFMGDRQEKTGSASEQEITGALVRLLSSGTQAIYFTTGHGEYDPLQTGDRSYVQVVSRLEAKNYTVEQLNLLTVTSIPENANAVVVAGPQTVLAENEVNLLKTYVNSGGNLFIMVDPSVFTEGGDLTDPLIAYLAEDLGVVVQDDLIFDLVGQQQLNQPLLAIGASYATHSITRGLTNYATVFPEARSLAIQETASGVTPVGVVFTQDQAWAESDLVGLLAGNQANPDDGVDQFGPLTLMVAVEDFNSGARVAILGDSDFASDEYYQAYGNSDLFVNSLDWIVGQEELIQLTAKSITTRTLNLPAVPYLTGVIVLIAIFLLPGSMLAVGIAVAISRKRRS